jgi:HPt (histidine-containing phosphotransfer) domain-containing protein
MKVNSNDIKFELLIKLAGGDDDFIREMLSLFLEKAPSSLEILEASIKNNDLTSVANQAHKLKSSIQIIADNELHLLIKKIEEDANKNGSKSELTKNIGQLNTQMITLFDAIKTRLSKTDKFTL